MPEKAPLAPNLPSGYESSESLIQKVTLDETTLPWLTEPYELSVSRCTLQGGETFLLASAIGSNPKLVEAARTMNEGQQRSTDNMFYSRIPTFVRDGFSPSVETMQSTTTGFPIHVMRNKSGQRVYFSRISLGLAEEQTSGPTIVRLAACDKNKQVKVMSVLSGKTVRQNRLHVSK